jgi:type II secretion system protein D
MSKRIIYYTGLVSLLLVWVLAQTPEEQAAAAPAQAEQVAPVTPLVVPGAVAPPAVPQPPSPTVPGKPSTTPKPPPNKAASPEANGITDGKLPTIQAGQNNKSVKAPKPADICDFAFNFPKLNAEGLGFVYRQLTGRRVVMTADVKDLEIYFVQPPPITYGEATDLLKAACLMHGFVFAPGGEGWDKLTTATQGPKPGTGDIPLVTSPLALPDGDEVVRYVMTLKYMKPDEVSRVFQTVVTQFNTFGSVVAVPNASALIITENTSLIRSLIELQAKIDVPSSDVQTKFFKVQFGDVEELAATLSEIFSQQSSSQATAGVQRVGQIQPANTAGLNNSVQVGGASSSGAGEAPPVQIVPDLRTNRIFVMARPIDLVFIETLIKEFDSPSDQRNFLRRKLKFLAVGDFLDVASDALTRAFGGSSGNSAGGAAGGAAGGRAPTSNSTGGRSSSGRSSGSSTNQFGGQSGTQSGGGQLGGGGSSGGIGSSGGLSDPQANTKPLSVLVGRTLLVADNITNSIVVQGPPAGVEIINNLLDEIDVKADQVMISTVFGQLSLSDNLEYGIDWLRDLDKTIGQPGRSGIGGTAGGVLPDITPITDFANSATKGLGIYGTIGDHLSGYLNALQETGDFNVISRPTIFTANNQKGTISSGTQIAVPSNSTQGFNGGGQSTNIEYRNVVLSLEVIPLINSADEVTLQISLVSQGVGENRTIGAGVNAYDVPDIISRELLTTVTVPNNQTVVLGGLITEENKKNISGVPILCQIPGIGKLFSKTTDDKSRNELLIFIRPNIIRDSRSLDQANRDMDNRYEMSSDVRSFDAPQPSVLPIKPVEVIEDDKSVVPEKPVTAPGKNSKKVTSTAPDIDYNAAPKAKPVSNWKWFGK